MDFKYLFSCQCILFLIDITIILMLCGKEVKEDPRSMLLLMLMVIVVVIVTNHNSDNVICSPSVNGSNYLLINHIGVV